MSLWKDSLAMVCWVLRACWQLCAGFGSRKWCRAEDVTRESRGLNWRQMPLHTLSKDKRFWDCLLLEILQTDCYTNIRSPCPRHRHTQTHRHTHFTSLLTLLSIISVVSSTHPFGLCFSSEYSKILGLTRKRSSILCPVPSSRQRDDSLITCSYKGIMHIHLWHSLVSAAANHRETVSALTHG